MEKKRRHREAFACALAVLASGVTSSAVGAGAMIVDVAGQCRVESAPCEVLQILSAGEALLVEIDSVVKVAFYKPRVEYTLIGPSRASVTSTGLQMHDGPNPKQRSLDPRLPSNRSYSSEHKRLFGLRMLSSRMRGLQKVRLAISPVNTVILNVRPTFRWRVEDPSDRFQLRVATERSLIYDEEVGEGHATLPITIRFLPGVRYYWTIESVKSPPDSDPPRQWFELLDDEIRDGLLRQAPGEQATFSARVLYADRLERHDLREAAIARWRALHRERPGQPLIAERARR